MVVLGGGVLHAHGVQPLASAVGALGGRVRVDRATRNLAEDPELMRLRALSALLFPAASPDAADTAGTPEPAVAPALPAGMPAR